MAEAVPKPELIETWPTPPGPVAAAPNREVEPLHGAERSHGTDSGAAEPARAAEPADSGGPEALLLLRERALLRRLRRGEERAFAELVREHQDRVYDLVFRMVGDREEALDLSQEVFVSIHAALPRFRGDSRLSTWIFRVARNHCLNRLKYLGRRARGRSTEISDVPEGELEAHVPRSPRPDELIDEGERRVLVQRAIAELDEDQRLLVVLRDVEGLSYHEIAAVTDQPEGTVKSGLHRARAALAGIVARLEKE